MGQNKQLKVLSLIIALVCFFIGLVYWYTNTCEKQLKNSLNFLMGDVLKGQYEIISENLGQPGPDLDGYWMINVDKYLSDRIGLIKEFGLADNADLLYYGEVFQKSLPISKPLDGYELYRAEMTLGEGSICKDYPCNIEVLIRRGWKTVYIGISNI